MGKYTALLIAAYLGGLSGITLMLWPALQKESDLLIAQATGPLTLGSLNGMAAIMISGAVVGVLSIFLARATCYLFIDAPGQVGSGKKPRDPATHQR